MIPLQSAVWRPAVIAFCVLILLGVAAGCSTPASILAASAQAKKEAEFLGKRFIRKNPGTPGGPKIGEPAIRPKPARSVSSACQVHNIFIAVIISYPSKKCGIPVFTFITASLNPSCCCKG